MKSIRTEFASGVRSLSGLVGLCVAILLSAALGIIFQSEAIFHKQESRDAQVQARILAASTSASVDFDDRAATKSAVQALSSNPDIRSAIIYDKNGKVFMGYDRASGGSSIILRSIVKEPGVVYGSAPLQADGHIIGRATVGMSIEPMARRVTRYLLVGLFLVLSIAFVIVFGASQAALRKANNALEAKANELVSANSALHVQMDERQRTEVQLQQAQKMQALGQLTGGIAHDFNNLLQVVLGAMDIIHRSTNDEMIQKWSARGLEAGSRATKLTSQLLAFSRIQKLQLKPVKVSPVLFNAQELLTSTLGPNHHVALELHDTDICVMADPTQLELAVMNLAINARDAMPDGGTVTISTHLATDQDGPRSDGRRYLCISVADAGTGMSQQVLDHAFEPFYTTKGVGKGTGLGLSMVYGMAEQSGGKATITSAEGKGTTVEIWLPEEQAVVAIEQNCKTDLVLPKGLKALVVDDDADVLQVNRAMMEELGFSVVEASSGEEALDVVHESKPDLVLMDYAMPGLNGVETVERLMKNGGCPPTLFVTGFSNSDAIRKVMPDAHVLMKPFDSKQLKQCLGQTLNAVRA